MEIRFSDYKTVKETSEEWGVTERWVLMYCNNGRIPGAMKKGNLWLIPASAQKPEDGRKNNRRQPGRKVKPPAESVAGSKKEGTPE